ncbi:hypothetical protein B0H14DRAFT_2566648 [Mycena olivaceomarginata]|nr:hypothetical protein B0H14DRAFT_2566648 [Mycena olivaceomarginata]
MPGSWWRQPDWVASGGFCRPLPGHAGLCTPATHAKFRIARANGVPIFRMRPQEGALGMRRSVGTKYIHTHASRGSSEFQCFEADHPVPKPIQALTIKAFPIGQKEFVTGQATFQSVPQNPNGGRRLPGCDLNAPRTQMEVVACQATISMPPEPQKRIIACQAKTSMPPEPKRRSQLARPQTRCPQNPNGNRDRCSSEIESPTQALVPEMEKQMMTQTWS